MRSLLVVIFIIVCGTCWLFSNWFVDVRQQILIDSNAGEIFKLQKTTTSHINEIELLKKTIQAHHARLNRIEQWILSRDTPRMSEPPPLFRDVSTQFQ